MCIVWDDYEGIRFSVYQLLSCVRVVVVFCKVQRRYYIFTIYFLKSEHTQAQSINDWKKTKKIVLACLFSSVVIGAHVLVSYFAATARVQTSDVWGRPRPHPDDRGRKDERKQNSIQFTIKGTKQRENDTDIISLTRDRQMLFKHFYPKRFKTDVIIHYLQKRVACPVDENLSSKGVFRVWLAIEPCVLCILLEFVWGLSSCLLWEIFYGFFIICSIIWVTASMKPLHDPACSQHRMHYYALVISFLWYLWC